jgi:hypothetical protein
VDTFFRGADHVAHGCGSIPFLGALTAAPARYRIARGIGISSLLRILADGQRQFVSRRIRHRLPADTRANPTLRSVTAL